VNFVGRLHYYIQATKEDQHPIFLDKKALTNISRVESFFSEESKAGVATKITQYKMLAHWIQFVKKETPVDDNNTYIGVQRLEDQLKSWKKGANKKTGEDHGQTMFDNDPFETYEPQQEFVEDSRSRDMAMKYIIQNKDGAKCESSTS